MCYSGSCQIGRCQLKTKAKKIRYQLKNLTSTLYIKFIIFVFFFLVSYLIIKMIISWIEFMVRVCLKLLWSLQFSCERCYWQIQFILVCIVVDSICFGLKLACPFSFWYISALLVSDTLLCRLQLLRAFSSFVSFNIFHLGSNRVVKLLFHRVLYRHEPLPEEEQLVTNNYWECSS